MLGGTVGEPNPEAMARFINWIIDTCIEIERREAEEARARQAEAIETEFVEETE